MAEAKQAGPCGRGEAWQTGSLSQARLLHQVRDSAFQGSGETDKHVEGDVLFSPFDLADIVPVTVGDFGQLLLREPKRVAAAADGSAELFAV